MMDHFLSGLDSGPVPWYSPRPVTNTHEFAIGNSSFQLIPITSAGLTTGIHSPSVAHDFCNSNSGSDSNPTNPNSAFRPLHGVKIKNEGEAMPDDDRQGTLTPIPSIALTPLSANRAHHSHKAKSGERWDTKKVCNICGKVLSRGDKLKNHLRTHTNHYPYHCDACGQGFLRSEGLRVHTRVHTGERPYVCILCGKAYTRKDKLTRHAIVHTGERPFVCQHCGKSFTRKDKMQRHELIHRVDKPFSCSPCNLEFVRQETLNTHIEKKHPERLPYTIVQQPATYHPHDLDLANLLCDSKLGIVKIPNSSEKIPSSDEPPSTTTQSSGSNGSDDNTLASGSATDENNIVLNNGAALLCSTSLYSGVTLPSSTSITGTSVLSSASSYMNGFSSGSVFPSVTSVHGGSGTPSHS